MILGCSLAVRAWIVPSSGSVTTKQSKASFGIFAHAVTQMTVEIAPDDTRGMIQVPAQRRRREARSAGCVGTQG